VPDNVLDPRAPMPSTALDTIVYVCGVGLPGVVVKQG
jgi:hypothetical protein